MFTKQEDMPDGIRKDYTFYKMVGGEPMGSKKRIINQILIIWTTKIVNKGKNAGGKPLDTSTHATYIKMLFSAFATRDVQYKSSEFKGEGEFLGVLNHDWNEK